ncbi:MAG: hypothetical protein Q4F00_04795 [bacterium]|nr:hypothetical protein [bacterium]
MNTRNIYISIVIFIVAAVLINYYIVPRNVPSTNLSDSANRQLFSKDLNKRLNRGQLVVVDKDKSDKYIQEDFTTYDLGKAYAFARYKSEVLQQPLYVESKSTFNTGNSVASVDPEDRRAWQELVLLEIQLKDAYSKAHPKDTVGYSEQKALDPKKTPEAMLKFIDAHSKTHLVATALAHIEYCYCIAQNNAAQAIATYDNLEKKYSALQGDERPEYLLSLLPEYRNRAQKFRENKLKG